MKNVKKLSKYQTLTNFQGVPNEIGFRVLKKSLFSSLLIFFTEIFILVRIALPFFFSKN